MHPSLTHTSTSIPLTTMPAATSADGFKSQEIFDSISTALMEDGKALVAKVKGIYGFKVKGGPNGTEGFWIVDAKNGLGSVEFNGKGNCYAKISLIIFCPSQAGCDFDHL